MQMGDRATINLLEKINGKDQGVELYTHWGGQEAVLQALYEAMTAAPDRMTDGPYFARIVFEMLTKDEKGEGEFLGYGIWAPHSQEDEYGGLSYYVDTQTVVLNGNTMTAQAFMDLMKKVSVLP
jgi:hypothetical protein